MTLTEPATTDVPLSTGTVTAQVVHQPRDLPVRDRTIVVNLGTTPATVAESPRKAIPPLSSAVLRGTTVGDAELLLLLRPFEHATAAPITDEPGWRLLADALAEEPTAPGTPPASFPRDIPLWKGPRHRVGAVRMDSDALLAQTGGTAGTRDFDVWLNLWFAPAGTDCAIHNRHDFLEVHTQVLGHGRMQKFHTRHHDSLYQDELMSPGYTTPDPFCEGAPDGGFRYPWHQYRADSDCVWLAVEYHATTR